MKRLILTGIAIGLAAHILERLYWECWVKGCGEEDWPLFI